MGMTSVRMPDDLLEHLEATAARLRRSKGWIINDAVLEWIDSWGTSEEREPPR